MKQVCWDGEVKKFDSVIAAGFYLLRVYLFFTLLFRVYLLICTASHPLPVELVSLGEDRERAKLGICETLNLSIFLSPKRQ
tara:strand:- start:4084 stop:4326 length:243 start_codon:yes stop_codon:yes gene_type:complete